jgi:isoleucyl-tRNA synthetase
LAELLDDLSNWYVRRSRPRFWKSSDPAAHTTLHRALRTFAQLLAPFCPFLTDDMYRNLTASGSSVHLSDWPVYDEAAIDDKLEAEMALARTLVSLGRAARADAKLGVRQPLPRAIALLASGDALRDEVVQEIKDELNVKRLEVVDSLEGLLSYRVVPNFRALGPRLGKLAPRVKTLLESVDGGEVRRAFDDHGSFTLDVDGDPVTLEPGDVEIRAEQHADLTLAQDGPHAVALDLTLDDDLRAEGIAREVIRLVNDRRKTNGLALTDRIAVVLRSTPRIVDAVQRHVDWIKAEVLATAFEAHAELLETAADGTVDGDPVWLDLRRV